MRSEIMVPALTTPLPRTSYYKMQEMRYYDSQLHVRSRGDHSLGLESPFDGDLTPIRTKQ